MAFWFVDNAVGASGDGLAWGTAWKNFSNIVWGSINPGDTVYLSGGASSQTWSELLAPTASGTNGNNIFITKGVDAGHSGEVIIDGGSARNCVTCSAIHNVTLDNLTLQNTNNACLAWTSCTGGMVAQYLKIHTGSSATALGFNPTGCTAANGDNFFQRNTVDTPTSSTGQTDCLNTSSNTGRIYIQDNICQMKNTDQTVAKAALRTVNDTLLTVRRNRFQRFDTAGGANYAVFINGITGKVEFYNNLAYELTALFAGDIMRVVGSPAYIYNNAFFGGHNAVNFQGGGTSLSELKNNICFPNGAGYCVVTAGGLTIASSQIDGNIHINNGGNPPFNVAGVDTSFATWQGTNLYDTHGFNSDPVFNGQTTADFTIASTSPAINTGLPLGLVVDDFNATARPQGPSYDIGAYEFQALRPQIWM